MIKLNFKSNFASQCGMGLLYFTRKRADVRCLDVDWVISFASNVEGDAFVQLQQQ